jgi:hypothetical protein
MKALLSLVLLLATVFVFANVRQVDPASATEGSEIIKMRVNSSKVQCEGYNGNTLCYEVQKGASIGTDNWEALREPIEGLNYEAGYIYDITVKIERVENPQANQPHHKHILMDVVAKVPAQ